MSVQPQGAAQLGSADYLAAFPAIATALALLEALPLGACIDTVKHHESVAAIVEPTAYIRGGANNLHDQEKALYAAFDFVTALHEIRDAR